MRRRLTCLADKQTKVTPVMKIGNDAPIPFALGNHQDRMSRFDIVETNVQGVPNRIVMHEHGGPTEHDAAPSLAQYDRHPLPVEFGQANLLRCPTARHNFMSFVSGHCFYWIFLIFSRQYC
jgi:hypothetical protein